MTVWLRRTRLRPSGCPELVSPMHHCSDTVDGFLHLAPELQPGPERHQLRLGQRPLAHLHPQHRFPPQVKRNPLQRTTVGLPLLALEEYQLHNPAQRHARELVVQRVEISKRCIRVPTRRAFRRGSPPPRRFGRPIRVWERLVGIFTTKHRRRPHPRGTKRAVSHIVEFELSSDMYRPQHRRDQKGFQISLLVWQQWNGSGISV